MHRRKKDLKKIFAAIVSLLVFYLCSAVLAQATGVISGSYLNKTDTALTLEIKIGSPAPVTLLIIQHLPPGTTPAAADPPFKKYNKKNGEMRWLLRNVQAGTLNIQLTLTGSVKLDNVHAEIRCMDPVTGKLTKTLVN